MRAVVSVVTGVILVVASLAFWRSYAIQGGPHQSRSKIYVEPASLDLGLVWAREDFPWTIRFRNDNNRGVSLSRLRASCQCVQISPQSLILPQRGVGEVALLLNLHAGELAARSFDSTPVEIDILAEVSDGVDGAWRETWTLKGAVRQSVLFEVPELVFEEQSNQLEPDHAFSSSVVHFETACSYQNVLLHVEPRGSASATLTRHGPSRGALQIVPSEDTLDGPFSFWVDAAVETVEGIVLPSARLPVSGICVRDAYATPSMLVVGPRGIGDFAEGAIVVKARTGRPFEIESIESTSEHIEATVLSTSVREAVLSVRLGIRDAGLQKHYVLLKVKIVGAESPQTLRIPVSYVGFAAEAVK